MSPLLLGGIVTGLALVLTLILTPLARGAAIAGGMVREVQSDRWHKRATPAIGGIAIYSGFGLALGVGYLLAPDSIQGLGLRAPLAVLPWSAWTGLFVASTAAFLVGLVDDFVHLRPLPKLLGQLIAATILVGSGVGVWLTGSYPLDVALSLFWFVGITNALNLLDNMDGLAAGIAAIAAAYLSLLFILEGASGLAILSLAFCASLLGFLAHNYPPARIFMGDSGSLFLGLFLAGLALAPAPGLSRSLATVLAAPVLILGVPILDTTLVTVGRILEGRPVSQGGRDHTSHRFVDLGLSEKRTLWLLWGLAAAGGAVGVVLRAAERGTALLLGGVLVGALTLVGAYLLTMRFKVLEESGEGGHSLYRFLIQGQRRYPLFVLLLDGVWIALAYYGAYLIRWDPGELAAELPYFQRTVALYVGVKLLAFVLSGTYTTYWSTFGLHDAIRVLRANVAATLLAAGVLFLTQRVGLSRGVVVIDLLVCTMLTVGARLSFRWLEGTTRRWADSGIPALVVASLRDADLAIRCLQDRDTETELKIVGVVTVGGSPDGSRMGSLPVFGGEAGLARAVVSTGAQAVVVMRRRDGESTLPAAVEEHLATEGGLDVFRLDVVVRRLTADQVG